MFGQVGPKRRLQLGLNPVFRMSDVYPEIRFNIDTLGHYEPNVFNSTVTCPVVEHRLGEVRTAGPFVTKVLAEAEYSQFLKVDGREIVISNYNGINVDMLYDMRVSI